MNYRAWILSLDKFEIGLRVNIAVERNRLIKSVSNGFSGSISQSDNLTHVNRLNRILNNHYNTIIPFYRKQTRKQIKSSHKHIELKQISDLDSLLVEWASTESLRKARLIADTNIDDITSVISNGVAEGLTLDEIAKNIKGVSAMTPYRASVVARTETHNAATYASIQSVREVEQETGAKFMKQWIATNDARTRDSHLEMIGSDPIPTDEKFYVNGEWLDRPGDSSGKPENIINCRCQVIFSEQ